MTTNDAVQVQPTGWNPRRLVQGDGVTRSILFVLLALFSFAMFYPFLWLIFSSFKTGADIVRIPVSLLPERWTLEAYQMVLDPNSR